MSRVLRLTLLTLAGLLLAALLAALITVYVLLQPERFTAMLQGQARSAGLELNLASPASPTLFPRPALELQGLTLNAKGATLPILLAARGRLALPWRTVLGGPTVISRLEIDAPRVDLEALQAWLSSLPPVPERAPTIPRVDAGISITRGTVVRANQLLLSDLSLDTGSLVPGKPFPLTVSAKDADGMPMQLRLSATPRLQGSALQLDNIALHLSYGQSLVMQLAGAARWHGAADASASLAGKLDHAGSAPYDMSLRLDPANQRDPLLLALKLDGPDNHADLRLPPLALADWWSQLHDPHAPKLSTPPGHGHLDAARIDAGAVHVEGLSVEVGDEVPAPASSATPAAAGTAASPSS